MNGSGVRRTPAAPEGRGLLRRILDALDRPLGRSALQGTDAELRARSRALDEGGNAAAAVPVAKALADRTGAARDLRYLAGLYARCLMVPEAVATYLALAEIYRLEGRDELVIAIMRVTLRLDPTRCAAWRLIAEAFERLGRDLEACEAFARAEDCFGTVGDDESAEAMRACKVRLGANRKRASSA